MASQAVLYYLLLFPLLLVLLLRTSVVIRRRPRRRSTSGGRRLPPWAPGQLPIIGHLHLVGSHPHVSLRDIAGEHGAGGLVLLRLGQVPTLVVSSPIAAEAVLRAHDHAMASRPPSAVADILLSGASDVALAPYGEYWRQARKLVTAHLLSATKVHSLRRAREEEVAAAIAGIRELEAAGVAVDVREMLGSFVNDVVCRAVSGKSLSRHQQGRRNRMFRELIECNTALLGGFTVYDYFPSLPRLLCGARAIAKLKKRWDVLLDEIIDEHIATNKSPMLLQEDSNHDFIDVLLSLQQEYSLTREQVKAILMDMFAAGTDTSSVVLEYAMVELIRSPHLMTKLRAEITSNTPNKGQKMVKEENLNNMTYLKAVVKETLRLHPPAPLLLPHISMEKCDVNGYTIPAGTHVIVNVWALGRDPMSWERPEEFMPERFITSTSGNNNTSVDFKGRDFKFLPFGAGRRICPGINFGVATIEIMLANLVYCFDWELPDGLSKDDIDMTEVYGLVTRRKENLLLVPTSLRN